MNDTHSDHSEFERIAIAAFLAVLGFLTGIISVWMLTNLPGVETSGSVYLTVAIIPGIACFIFGYKSSERTIDILGEVWNTTWKLSVGILSIIRSLSR
jgi:hypothetical protein